MKIMFINKLKPEYKKYLLSKEPENFQETNNMAVALWSRKYPKRVHLKSKSIFAVEAEFGLSQNSNLSEEEKKICINTIKNNRNNGQNFRQNGGFSNYNNTNSNGNNQQSKPKKDKKRKDTGFNTIKCWFCNKTGHSKLSADQENPKTNL